MTTDTKAVSRWECRVATNASGRPYVDDMEFENGRYVLFTDHQRVVGELHAEIVKIRGYEVSALQSKMAELRAESDSLRKDAERWRHARRILPVMAIEHAQEQWVNWARNDEEEHNIKADKAIDAAMREQAE